MPRPWFRLVASALLAVCATAQLGTLAHLALVRHVRCAEHARIEHADEAHETHAHVDHDALSGRDDHAHDGCALDALRLVAAPTILDAPSRIVAFDVSHLDDAPHDAPHLAARVLDHAPKTSPPA
ncbi:hypothetical protein [Sandaracinus amylolyticus]|uniref:hypothetical protein n=1 Tax=Sandaracinus amylolyticus TaxID=927083 RepID=UPI001F15B847|nr:hypothetical protein [Sandaracinus amylolyticus]UJR85087.1 Hypothetical protein I5071_71660 [Sandaracinus amylolyticus]